jgi:transposase
MMGTKARIFTPITAVSFEELVPANHFYRHLDRVVDLSFVRDLVKKTYAERGRPSIDPVVFWHRCNSRCSLTAFARNDS